VTAEEDGEGAEQEDRRAWRRSNWIQATCVLGFIGLGIVFGWAINDRLTYLGPVVLGIAVGLAFLAVRYARRRYSDRP
jgi:hypothetical protein